MPQLYPYSGYFDRVKAWSFFDRSYEGGHRYKFGADANGVKVLLKHERETGEGFKWRENLAVYFNYCAFIIDLYNYYVFRKTASRSTDPTLVEWFRDVDNEKTDIQTFFKRLAHMAQRFGLSWVGADSPYVEPTLDQIALYAEAEAEAERSGTVFAPPDEGRQMNLQEQIEEGIKPYLRAFEPSAIVDREYDKNGLKRIVVKEVRRMKSSIDAKEENETLYREWFADTFREWKETEKSTDGGQPTIELTRDHTRHGFQGVPFRCLVFRPVTIDPYHGVSQIADVAELNKKIFQYWSLHDEDTGRNVFPRAFILGAGEDDVDIPEEGNAATLICINQPDAKLERGVSDAAFSESIRTAIAIVVKEIYRIAMNKGGDPYEKTAAESGEAKARDLEGIYQVCAALADQTESTENAMLRIVAPLLGVDADIAASTTYPDEFDLKSIAEEIGYLYELTEASLMPQRVIAAQTKKVIRMLFENDEDYEKMIAEVDEIAKSAEADKANNSDDEGGDPDVDDDEKGGDDGDQGEE